MARCLLIGSRVSSWVIWFLVRTPSSWSIRSRWVEVSSPTMNPNTHAMPARAYSARAIPRDT